MRYPCALTLLCSLHLFRNRVLGILSCPRKNRMTLNLNDLILVPLFPHGVAIASVVHRASFMQCWRTDLGDSCLLIKQSLYQLLHLQPLLFYNRDLYREVLGNCSRAQNPTGRGWIEGCRSGQASELSGRAFQSICSVVRCAVEWEQCHTGKEVGGFVRPLHLSSRRCTLL